MNKDLTPSAQEVEPLAGLGELKTAREDSLEVAEKWFSTRAYNSTTAIHGRALIAEVRRLRALVSQPSFTSQEFGPETCGTCGKVMEDVPGAHGAACFNPECPEPLSDDHMAALAANRARVTKAEGK